VTSFTNYQKTIARIYKPAFESDLTSIVGTGFLVSPQYLLTCAHVVFQALDLEDVGFREVPEKEMPVDFPENPQLEQNSAVVEIWQPFGRFFQVGKLPKGKDIALLRLKNPVPINLLEIIPLASETDLKDHNFSLFGFPDGSDQGQTTDGQILAPGYRLLQLRVDENRPVIIGGFSGSPLWDKALKKITGMAITADDYDWETDRGGRDASAIPATVLRDVWCKQGQLIELLMPYAQEKWIEKAYKLCRREKWESELPDARATYRARASYSTECPTVDFFRPPRLGLTSGQ